jgi:hypothetical protein
MSSRSSRRHRSRPRSSQSLLLAVTACSALAISLLGARMLLAGLNQAQAEAFARHWHQERRVPGPDEWTRVNQAAIRAVNLYPVANAQYLQLLGENWLWRQYGHPMGSADPALHEARSAARTALQQAAELRPHWPGHWSALARAQAAQLDFSASFNTSLQHAMQKGPYRPGIQLQIAELGLLTWQLLDPQARQMTQQAIRYSIQLRPAQLSVLGPLAQQAGNTGALCSSLYDLPLYGTSRQAHERLCPPLSNTL